MMQKMVQYEVILSVALFLANLHLSRGDVEQRRKYYAGSKDSKSLSAGRVRSINYNGARFFLDRCLEVKSIHFDFEKDSQRDPPPPVLPPSTTRPVLKAYSNKAMQTRKCLDFACFAQDLQRDLRQINGFRCRSDNDCQSTEEKRSKGVESKLVCREFSSTHSSTFKFCDCPEYTAYNPLSCQCDPAEQCGNNSEVFCQNGMKCMDSKCSCSNFKKVLIEPHGQFCVEKKTSNTINEFPFTQARSSDGGFVTAIIILAIVASVFVLGLCIYLSSQSLKNGFFDRGVYKCDEDLKEKSAKARMSEAGQPRNQDKMVHVAAWELPGLDVLTEEQTMKYLHREHQRQQLAEGTEQEPNCIFLDDGHLSAVTSTPNSKSYVNDKLNQNNIALKRFGGQQNVNKPVNGEMNGIDDGSTTCHSSTSSPSSGRSGEGSLPESDRFENPAGENDKSNGKHIQNDPNGLTRDPDGNMSKNVSNDISMSRLSIHSLTVQSNIL